MTPPPAPGPVGRPTGDVAAGGGDARPLGTGTRVRARWWWLAFVLVLLVAAGWYATHPRPLPREGRVAAQTPAGVPVVLGVLSAPGRDVALRSVRWDSDVLGEGDDLVARVCRGGSVSATRDLAPFCREVVPAEGAVLRSGDQLVLEVTAVEPGRLALPGVVVAFRDGLQWGEQRAGRDLEVVVTEQ